MVAAEIIAAEVCLDGSLADLIMDLPLSSYWILGMLLNVFEFYFLYWDNRDLFIGFCED